MESFDTSTSFVGVGGLALISSFMTKVIEQTGLGPKSVL